MRRHATEARHHARVETTARRLLVAAPTLLDPNFGRSVVFMIEHNDEGALGVVLNRPTEAEIGDAIPEWSDLTAPPRVAFLGGPVQAGEAVIGLARVVALDAEVLDGSEGWQPLFDRIGTVDLARAPESVRPPPEAVRIFAGYAGWASGQLEAEIARSDWHVIDALPGDLLTPAPDALWRAVLRRQGGELAVRANFPHDPSEN
jgi:putative transcriptional regulator